MRMEVARCEREGNGWKIMGNSSSSEEGRENKIKGGRKKRWKGERES